MEIIESILICPSQGNHYKNRLCRGICYDNGDSVTIRLEQTKKWFQEHRFQPQVGDKIISETQNQYTITGVSYQETRPKYALLEVTFDRKIEASELLAAGGIAS